MSISKLLSLQAENDTVRARMLTISEGFKSLTNRHTAPRAISGFNLFQTPINIANLMIDHIPNTIKTPKILEPSAGLGRLYTAVYGVYGDTAKYTLCDNNPECLNVIYSIAPKAIIKQGDFLLQDFTDKFDIIIMNPPFKQGLDIKHILHARQFLSENGILISLCYNGTKQNKKLRPVCNTWQVLPEKSFKEAGTLASVCLLTIKNK